MSEFLSMGGHALFVWSSYGMAAVGLVGALVLSIKSWRAREREFEDLKALRIGKENP